MTKQELADLEETAVNLALKTWVTDKNRLRALELALEFHEELKDFPDDDETSR